MLKQILSNTADVSGRRQPAQPMPQDSFQPPAEEKSELAPDPQKKPQELPQSPLGRDAIGLHLLASDMSHTINALIAKVRPAIRGDFGNVHHEPGSRAQTETPSMRISHEAEQINNFHEVLKRLVAVIDL